MYNDIIIIHTKYSDLLPAKRISSAAGFLQPIVIILFYRRLMGRVATFCFFPYSIFCSRFIHTYITVLSNDNVIYGQRIAPVLYGTRSRL